MRIIAFSFIGLLLLTSCVRNPATHKVHARLLSIEAERKIGEETKRRILEQYRVFESTTVTHYVDQIGQRLANLSDRPSVDYEFTVLDNDLVNAFAAPGGFIFVTRGLLESMNDEAELAMVLGHEIAHVAALHGVQMIQKEMGQNALTILGTIGAALTLGPEALLMVANTADLFSSLYLLGYSRDKELEADNYGLQYLLRAGYDPQASLRFLNELQKMDKEEAKGWDLYFRTHPNTADRIQIIEHMIGQEPNPDAVSNRKAYQEVKNLLPKINLTERGVIDKNVYRNMFHGLTLNVPPNWELSFYHSQSLVSFQTKDQKAEGRLQVIVISSNVTTAEELTHQYAKAAGFQEEGGRSVLYNAGYGYLSRYKGISPRGEIMDFRLFVTIRKKKGYLLLCAAPFNRMDSYILDIEQIMRGFRFG